MSKYGVFKRFKRENSFVHAFKAYFNFGGMIIALLRT